jgi:DNA-directed RNA polymerase subunit beta'
MGMVLDCVPVIPPDLRPMVQLDGGRFATSDLNDLYRRVINRNNRLKRLLDLGAPEIIVNNEKRMLQEAVDALFDNGRRGRPVTGPGNRPLKSLSDMLKGKQGRFRQNLLGKRVDYSGRSVIVVGPQLRLHQCGLPKQMALELFKPFVMKRLVDLNHAQNIKSAKRMVERATGGTARYAMVWDVLEEVITEHPVLLNRAPTLHRLGIQAFEPQLVEGKAIQIHPLVCTAFNADFDGDQMAVHLPLSAEAQAEARILMLSSNNILSPAHGRPITSPTQDMVLGLYYLTLMRDGSKGEGRTFGSVAEAIMAYDTGELDLQARVKIRIEDLPASRDGSGAPEVLRGVEADERPWVAPEGWEPGQPVLVETTLGRCLFNEAMPVDYPFVDHEVRKAQLGEVVNDLAERYPKVQVAATLDALKEAGFHWATRAGVTIAISDVVTPPEKAEILGRYEEQAEKVQKQYERGVITDDERRQELIEIWTRATTEVASKMRENFPKDNPIQMMVGSGARGNMLQVQQIAGMRGLVANPKGEIIPRPIKTNFREGLTVLEYFISTHGARKGLADTALRTADSGYLTRRLVDVSQDVIVREVDCGTDRGIMVPIAVEADGSITLDRDNVETRVYARTLAEDVVVNKKVLAEAGADLGDVLIGELVDQGVSEVRVRSVLTCDSKVGICGLCYGRSLATGKTVDVGEAVGIIAAQSIGEPGTQLTMRTFHTGGVAGEDITHGLPRVVELFEARQPKGRAPISEVAGRVSIAETDKSANFVVTPDDGGEPVEYPLSKRMLAWRWYDAESERARGQWRVEEGQHVEVGDQLHAGAVDPHEVLRILGPRAVQLHLVKEVQEVYRSQGVTIHDKHIEIIIRQMLKRVNILESGDTELLPGELAERPKFEEENRRVVAEGGTPAAGRPVLMGITKASLATESWLSAASFQETTRVLTDAAIHARSDSLLGLKENVIIGKLIPAGTGINRYRNVRVEPTEEAKAAVYTMMPYDDAGYDFGQGTGEAVPLEDYSFGQRPGGYGTDYGSGNYR